MLVFVEWFAAKCRQLTTALHIVCTHTHMWRGERVHVKESTINGRLSTAIFAVTCAARHQYLNTFAATCIHAHLETHVDVCVYMCLCIRCISLAIAVRRGFGCGCGYGCRSVCSFHNSTRFRHCPNLTRQFRHCGTYSYFIHHVFHSHIQCSYYIEFFAFWR